MAKEDNKDNDNSWEQKFKNIGSIFDNIFKNNPEAVLWMQKTYQDQIDKLEKENKRLSESRDYWYESNLKDQGIIEGMKYVIENNK